LSPATFCIGAGGYGSQDLQPDNALLSIEFLQHGIVTGLITPAARTAVRPVRIQQGSAGC
jgi:hypothetical protein